MRKRRGSTYWTSTMSGHLDSFQVGDVVQSTIVAGGFFYGSVKSVDKKCNKVMVAWGGGSLSQHDPEELQVVPFSSEKAEMRLASSGRRTKRVKADEKTVVGPQFVGDPETHGLDDPRGGGFSIMQNLVKDLRKENAEESKEGPRVGSEKTAGRKTKYKGWTIEESGDNYYITNPAGYRAFGETAPSIETAKKWIDASIRTNTKSAADSSELKSRRAMYWCGPERTYRLTRREQEAGEAECPKCKATMDLEGFTRGTKIYVCGGCKFKVTSDKAVT